MQLQATMDIERPGSTQRLLDPGKPTGTGGRLGRRITLWFLVLALVPLLLSGTAGYLVSRRIILSQTQLYLMALTEIAADHVAGEVERHQLGLQAFAVNVDLVRYMAMAVYGPTSRREDATLQLAADLNQRKLELQPFSDLFVVDSAGNVIAATREERLREGWRRPADSAGSGFPSLFMESALPGDDGSLTSAVADVPDRYGLMTTIIDASQRSLGAIAGTVDIDALAYFLRIPPHLAGDVHSYIIDGEGRPILVSHAHALVDPMVPLPSPLIHEPEGTVKRYLNYEGAEVLGVILPVPGLPWMYIAEVYVESAFGELRRLAVVSAAIGGMFALLLLGTAWLVSGSIVGPLRNLVRAAERIRQGELGVEVGIDRTDELGELGRTFDQMSRELLASSQRINELHDQEMRRAAQLASVGELASGIAHEIKNPIVGISSGLDLLSRQPGRTDRTNQILIQLRAQLARMESAIRDLLSYARPNELRLTVVEPRQLIDRVSRLIHPQAEASGIAVETRAAGSWPALRVDSELMTQALVNLALNAIQAMIPGGTVTFIIEAVDSDLSLVVEDTGPGVPDALLTSIFRPFMTTKHSGTGLGLAITRSIVERHGGRLTVDKSPGSGARFTITLPIHEETEASE